LGAAGPDSNNVRLDISFCNKEFIDLTFKFLPFFVVVHDRPVVHYRIFRIADLEFRAAALDGNGHVGRDILMNRCLYNLAYFVSLLHSPAKNITLVGFGTILSFHHHAFSRVIDGQFDLVIYIRSLKNSNTLRGAIKTL
jgi:hypothetical protein